jgi:hypothetical protein
VVFPAFDQRDDQLVPRARILSEALDGFAGELRLIDIADLVTFIRTENHPNLGDLVSSSLELYFRPDLFRYGWGADVRLRWGEPPTLMLDMEFRHLGVTMFFRLMLESAHCSVKLHYVSLQDSAPRAEHNTRRIAAAIADAKLPFSHREKVPAKRADEGLPPHPN